MTSGASSTPDLDFEEATEMEWALRLDLPMNPIPLPRPRTYTDRNGKSRTVKGAHVGAFYDEFRWLARTRLPRRFTPLEGPLTMRLLLWRHCTSSTNRGDLSNLVKAIEDAANPAGGWPGLYLDDRQIVAYDHVRIVDAGRHVAGRIVLALGRRKAC